MTEPTTAREPISETEAVKAAKLKVKLDQSLGRKTEPWIVELSHKSPARRGGDSLTPPTSFSRPDEVTIDWDTGMSYE